MRGSASPETAPVPAPTAGQPGYVGRFAPSPTGVLHAGSLVAALASWLDARAAGGRWLVRIEDVDGPRCVPGAAEEILRQLAACGLLPDAAPWQQSQRGEAYAQALARLEAAGWAYPCACTRKDIAEALAARGIGHARHAEWVYPGTCRPTRGGLAGRLPRAVRLLSTASREAAPGDLWIDWHDRRLGPQRQNLTQAVGDVVLRRADGLWAYQLAVVVDDAAQGVTHVVRGEDLGDNTPRQIRLQALLGLPRPRYLHTPLVLAADGHKLSKQNGAAPLDLREPTQALWQAAQALGLALPAPAASSAPGGPTAVADLLAQAVNTWRVLWGGSAGA
jgi:glutamyl-Q tRNA(Asp) synthetase